MNLSDFPKHIDVDLSTRCNLRCRFCHTAFFKPKEATDFSWEKFQVLLPALEQVEKVTLFSKFEPLICKDFLRIYSAVASFQHLEIYFSTNGVLLGEKVIDAIVGRLDYLTVSITGFTAESYKLHMGKDALSKVLHNLDALDIAKRERKTELPRLRISTLGALDTLDDLPKAVDCAKRFNAAEGVQVTSLIAYNEGLARLMPLNDLELFRAKAEAARQYANELGVRLVLQSGDDDENRTATTELGHRICSIPWQRVSIQPNGDVYPCPVANNPVGNIFEAPLEDIWSGAKMMAFRRGVNSADRMNDECKTCIHCRHKSVVDVRANDLSNSLEFASGMRRRREAAHG